MVDDRRQAAAADDDAVDKDDLPKGDEPAGMAADREREVAQIEAGSDPIDDARRKDDNILAGDDMKQKLAGDEGDDDVDGGGNAADAGRAPDANKQYDNVNAGAAKEQTGGEHNEVKEPTKSIQDVKPGSDKTSGKDDYNDDSIDYDDDDDDFEAHESVRNTDTERRAGNNANEHHDDYSDDVDDYSDDRDVDDPDKKQHRGPGDRRAVMMMMTTKMMMTMMLVLKIHNMCL